MREPIHGAVELAPDLEMEQRRQATAEWFATHIQPVARELEPRDYQFDIWATTTHDREAGKTRELLAMATGLGKTLVAAVDNVKYRQECEQAQPPMLPRTLYVSHLREINDQAERTFRLVMPDAEMQHINPAKAGDLPESDVDFALIQGLFRNLHKFDPEAYETIVWDEAHHTEAETYKAVREYFRPLYELALTATVDRMDGKDIRGYFGEPAYSKGLAEAIAEGYLTSVDYHIVLDKTIKEAVQQGTIETLQDIKDLFNKKPSRPALIQSMREEIEKLGLEDPKIMVFCESIDEADEMAELWGGSSLHSKSKGRSKKMEDFRTGRERSIFTKDLFNEGVDVPDVDLVVFLRATESETIFLQQLGRGLRLSPGKEKVTVLDFVANIERIAKVRELGRAIEKRAGELLREVSEDTRGGGLRVHAGESDFDFDSIAVDLLEKYGLIREATRRSDFLDLTNDQLVALALELAPEAPLGMEDIRRLSDDSQFISTNTVIRRFGSVVKFQQACGFEVKARNYNALSAEGLTDQEMIDLALSLKSEGGLTDLEIRELAREGVFFSTNTIIRRFGSYDAFRRACGFEVSEMKNMTAEELIARALELKPDGPLTTREIEDLSKAGEFVSLNKIRSLFGNVPEFQQACGFEVNKVHAMTNEEIVELALHLKPDGPITASEIKTLFRSGEFASDQIIRKRFGSVASFHQACGFEHVSKAGTFGRISPDQIIARALELKPDGPLSGEEIDTLSSLGNFFSYNSIKKYFGGIAEFQKACGFEPSGKAFAVSSTPEEVVARALELKPDGPLTTREIEDLSKADKFVGYKTVTKHFGSLRAFQKACGFEVRAFDARTLSNDQIIARALELKSDGPLTTKEIEEYSKGSLFAGTATIASRFGSITEFQKACGFEPSDQRQLARALTNDELVRQALAINSDRPLTTSEIAQLAAEKRFVSLGMLTKRFGTMKAFREACDSELRRKNNG